jgi:hypothetical protein
MGAWEDTVAKDVRANVPRVIAEEVLGPQYETYSGAANIKIVTPTYPAWLNKFDQSRRVPLKESVKSFRKWRSDYHDEMKKLLDQIAYYDTGTALLSAITDTKWIMYIRPYTIFGKAGPIDASAGALGKKGVGDVEATLRGGATAMPHYDAEGHLQPGAGLGTGTNTAVDITPSLLTSEAGRKMFSGPGSKVDEALFHEMVHASRFMGGVAYRLPVSQGYSNEEEYLAVVMTNVYMSEKGQTRFRGRHARPNIDLPEPEKFLDNYQRISMSPMVLIERFRLNTPKFYRDYSQIPANSAAFNPFREFRERKKAGTLNFNFQLRG